MIHIVDNFLSHNDCDKLIEFYHKNQIDSFQYHNSRPLYISNQLIYNNLILQYIYSRVKLTCYNLNDQNNISCYNFQIVKWDKFSFHMNHYDREDTKFSCILYLNDDYNGGNTVIEYKDVLKVKGKGKLLIIKNSDKIYHSVQTVLSGTRYTVAMWFENYY